MSWAEFLHQRRPLRATVAALATETSGPQLTVDGRAPFPLFEVDGSEPVPNPFVQGGKDGGRIRQAEVLLPPE